MLITEQALPTERESEQFFNRMKMPAQPQFARMSTLSAPGKMQGASDLPTGSDEAGAVVGKKAPIIIAFADGLAPDKRHAAMNSTQLSEQYADSKADRKTQALRWHDAYVESMRHCGWIFTSYVFSDHDTSKANVSMDSIVMDIVSMVAGANTQVVLELLGRVFDAIKQDTPTINLFDKNSKKDSVGHCQIMPCMESPGGIGVSVFTGLECHFSSLEGGAWFWKWKTSNLKIKKAATMVNLNFAHYQRHERTILSKLDGAADDFFANVRF